MADAFAFSSADRDSIKFDGKEFFLFKKVLLNTLRAKKLENTILENVHSKNEHDEVKEEGKKAIVKEKEKSQAVFSALFGALTKDLQRLFQHAPDGDAYALWNLMLKKYESKTMGNKIHVQNKLLQIKMAHDEHFDAYLARINEVVGELKGMGSKTDPDTLVAILLRGLPSSFESLIQSIEITAQDKALDFDQVCEHVRNKQEKVALQQAGESANFSSSAAQQKQPPAVPQVQQQAFYGAPPTLSQSAAGGWTPVHQRGGNNGQRERGNPHGGQHNNCYECGQPGHRKFDCPLNKDKLKCFKCRGIGHEDRTCRIDESKLRSNYGNRSQGRTSMQQQGYNRPWGPGMGGQGSQQTNYANHYYDSRQEPFQWQHEQQAVQHCSYFSSVIAAAAKVNPLSAYDYTKKQAALFNEHLTDALAGASSTPPDASEISIILDSGTTSHVAKSRTLLHDVREIAPTAVRVANNGVVQVHQAGNATLQANDGSSLEMKDVLFSPSFAENLLSVPRLIDSGHDVNFSNAEAVIVNKQTNKVSMRVPRAGNLYVIKSRLFKQIPFRLRQDGSEVAALAVSQAVTVDKLFTLWHRRYGHLSQGEMKKMVAGGAVDGIDPALKKLFLDRGEACVCDSCAVAKARRQPFGQHRRETVEVVERGDLFVVDTAGPIMVDKDEEIESLGGMKYLLTATDVKTRKVYGWTVRSKADEAQVLIDFCQQVKAETGRTIKQFHSDGGSEFLNNALQGYFRKEGIRFTYTTKGTPQHNAIAERLNGTLFAMARAILAHSQLPPTFWATAIHAAIYIRNRCTNARDSTKTPEELWSGKKPKVAHLRAYGCNAYIHVLDQERKKLDPKAHRGIFVGYSEEQGGAYRVYNLLTRRVEVSRDVQFDESSFTFAADVFKGSYREVKFSTDDDFYEHHTFENDTKLAQILSQEEAKQREEAKENVPDAAPAAPLAAAPAGNAQGVRRSERERKPPLRLGMVSTGDVVSNLARVELPLAQRAAKQMVQDVPVPTTFKEAMDGPHAREWKQAMDEEYDALMENHTFNVVEMPRAPELNLVGCKWVFSLKPNSDGSIERFKARLVAQGFTQKEGIDFSETFAPSLKLKSFRILVALAALYDLDMKHLDVKTAFLNADVEEEIYMKQPPGFHDGPAHMVCKLNKGLYGLRQASRNWNENLNAFILAIRDGSLPLAAGFKRCQSDTCVYVKISRTGRLIIIAVFVDDIIPLYSPEDAHEWGEIQAMFMRQYKMKNLGDAEWILGMKLTRDRTRHTIVITQENYVNKVLTQQQMQNSNPCSTPNSEYKLSKADCSDPSPVERTAYQSIVGALIYSSISTRADITHAVNVLSRFMISPGPNHLVAAKRVLRYLRGTVDEGLTYRGGTGEQLTIDAYTDATWSEDSDTRRSTTGYVIKINGCTVSWASKMQKTVSLSSAEAEYMALSATGQEVIWIKKFLSELYVNVADMPTRVWCDNQAAIEIASDDQHHDRTKHIDLRYHWIRDSIKRGDMTIHWISTHDQLADALTKALGPSLFHRLKPLIMSA